MIHLKEQKIKKLEHMKEFIAAIDLGTTKVVSAIGEKTDSGFRVVALKEAPSLGVSRGEVLNIQQVMNSLLPTLEEIRLESDYQIKDVYVGIAGQNIRCESNSNRRNRRRSFDLISEQEIKDMEYEMYKLKVNIGEEVLHVMPQFYNVEDHMGIVNPVGMTGGQIEGNYKLFIGKKNSAECSKTVIERAGLKLNRLILEPVASAAAVLTEDEKEIGVAMIDIGGGTTDLLIYHDNIIRHTAVIPFGGNSITEDLKTGCGVSAKTAEQIKIQYGSCYTEFAPENKTVIIPGIGGRDSREVSFKFISNIIEARVEEILDAVMYEIENSGYQDKLGAGIVITGGSSALTHLVPFVKFKTGFGARVVAPAKSITYDSCEAAFKPSSSTAVGLLLNGYDISQEPNLFESEEEAEELVLQSDFVAKPVKKASAEREKEKTREKEKSTKSKVKDSIFGAFGSLFDGMNNNDA